MTTPRPSGGRPDTVSEPRGTGPRGGFLAPAFRRAQSVLAVARARLAPQPEPSTPAADLRPIVERLDALEAMVEGLQDAVDRESRRHDARLDALARRLEPSELARALSEDARRRGL